MATHPALQARRALVKLILVIASVYRVVLDLNRESCDGDVLKAFKKVLLKAHPDKGGSEEHAKQLNTAKGNWDEARKPNGRPAEKPDPRDSNEIIPGVVASARLLARDCGALIVVKVQKSPDRI